MSRKIITAFGGIKPMADKISGFSDKPLARSTVQYWWDVGYIPIGRQSEVKRAADALGITVEPSDFAALGEVA